MTVERKDERRAETMVSLSAALKAVRWVALKVDERVVKWVASTV